METAVSQMNIFFLVTTIVVALIGVLAVIALVYAIKFIRDARLIAEALRDELTEIIDDVEQFREKMEGKASTFSNLLGALTAAGFVRRFLQSDNENNHE
jgi:Tfp pilus assembly protein PilE